jgi:hypothetical protein
MARFFRCRRPAVFSFVRNPWARALSSWHHVNKFGIHATCQEPFERWAELPSRYGAKCLGIRNCCKRRFGWLLEHTEPQTTCLFDDQGQPAVDFLGRVEKLDEDMQVGRKEWHCCCSPLAQLPRD